MSTRSPSGCERRNWSGRRRSPHSGRGPHATGRRSQSGGRTQATARDLGPGDRHSDSYHRRGNRDGMVDCRAAGDAARRRDSLGRDGQRSRIRALAGARAALERAEGRLGTWGLPEFARVRRRRPIPKWWPTWTKSACWNRKRSRSVRILNGPGPDEGYRDAFNKYGLDPAVAQLPKQPRPS